MDCKDNNRMKGPKIGLIMGTALASVALAGCSSAGGPRAETSYAKAQVALEKGQASAAITHAEAAVMAEPRNAEFRALMGAAYLEAGRFESAATSFEEALTLGNEDPRTVLSLALAKTASGENSTAVAALRSWERDLDPADLGLALALAGAPERGVHVLTNAIRSGQNTAKVRQNLAYTYALAGNWRAARIMAAEDVPADQLDARLSDWATTAKAEDYRVRVADLLGVDSIIDSGRPQYLALSNFDENASLVAEAAAQAPAAEQVALTEEPKPTVVEAPSSPAPVQPVEVASASSAPVVTPASAPKEAPQQVAAKPPVAEPKVAEAASAPIRYVSNPVIQKIPTSSTASSTSGASGAVAAVSSQRRMAMSSDSRADTHLVQLGSYDTHADAKRAWASHKAKFPQLSRHDVVITQAEVEGRTFYRVAAAGFGLRSARAMCSTVRESGGACFAYSKANPPAGAIDRGVRIAARTR